MSLNNSRFGWLFASHLSKWTWSKGYYWRPKVCFCPWPWPWNRPRLKIKNKPLRKTWWPHFFNSQLLFYQYHYPSITSALSLHLTTHALFKGLCPLQWMYVQSSAADTNATQIRLRCSRLKSLLHKLYGRRGDLSDRYQISTSPFHVDIFFTLSPKRLLMNFSIGVTRLVSYKKQELLFLLKYLGSPPFALCCQFCSSF